MSHRKKQSTKKMEDYQNTKVEFAKELGISGANNTEVNAKLASQGESKYSNKTMVNKHNYNNDQKTARED
ncbi:MAG: hypothetical protein RR942_00785 [Romboutsia sp.]